MKKIALTISIYLIHILSSAQTPSLEWQKCIGGSEHDDAKAIIQTSDGGYIVAGTTNSTDFDVTDNHGGRDFLVAKLNATGSIEWKKCYGGTNDDFAYNIIKTLDGGYLVGGKTSSNDGDVSGNTGPFGEASWLIKINDLGTLIWQRTLNIGQLGSTIRSILITSDDNIVISGTCYNAQPSLSYGDSFITKLNSDGITLWSVPVILGGSYHDNIYSMSATNDGGFILTGSTYSRNGDFSVNHGTGAVCDYWIVKVNSLGAIQWQKLYGGSGNDEANSIIQTSDGGYIVAGYTWSNNDGDVTGNHSSGYYDYWIVKLDNTGNLEWQKCYGSIYDDVANCIIQNSDGGYTVAGYARETVGGDATGNHGNSDFWVTKLSPNGTIIWQKSLGGSGWDEALCLRQTSDNGYIVCGTTRSNNADVIGYHGTNTFFRDFWIVKLSPENLSINNFEQNKLSIYPNPSSTTVNLQLPNEELIDSIIITDLTGKIILNQKQQENNVSIQNLEAGIYFIEAYSNENKYQTKFIKE